MSHHHSVHIPIYEGEEDPRQHWFICERMWDAADITDENRQIAQFAGALRKRVLTWYMNFTESQNRSKAEIKASFLALFKTEDAAHLATQKHKDIKQRPGESVREYNKRFKDLLSQIPANIDTNLLVQWYVVGLLHHVRAPLRMHDIMSLEEAFKKEQQMESDIDVAIPSEKGRLEDKIEMLSKTMRELTMAKNNV
jgi:hypothetical protein